ncbi:hypothetical protein [Streptomyces sp. GC420]|uniref:hypothetical protein n=1 Tax=Streptomyces sp. GC420 TaxID=2697568 RepID=UPI001414DE86|nr:hypothetical protein [Streptomyces sp. GC420]NBM15561.1 hypothetical protein [Streptomyces sp. GC420]
MGGLIERRADVLGPLYSCFPGLVESDRAADGIDGASDEYVLLDYPEPNVAARIENALVDGRVRISDADTDLEFEARVYVSSLSVGFVVVELPECPDDLDLDIDKKGHGAGLRALEAPYRKVLGRHIRLWCQRMEIALLHLPFVEERSNVEGLLPSGKMLWMHRILIDPGDNIPSSLRTGVHYELGRASCSVGYLFTSLIGGDSETLREVISGLILASQNWLIIDDATRLTAGRLMRIELDGPYNQTEIDRQYDEILDLTDRAAFRSVVFSESVRYVSNSQLRVKDAVDEAWGISEEGRTLTDRMASLREIFNLRRERVANKRDEFRNKIIMALTSLTVFQCVFIWYDFYTGETVKSGESPRPEIALMTLAFTVGGFTLVPFVPRILDAIGGAVRRLFATAGPPDGSGPSSPGSPGTGAPRVPAQRLRLGRRQRQS